MHRLVTYELNAITQAVMQTPPIEILPVTNIIRA